ncbi:J domain-containing protein [Campylobacterota bacterium DY0563]
MEEESYLYESFIIYNSELNLKDFVTIGEVDKENKIAYLDTPYEMVGPFCLNELYNKGKIYFEACMVMTQNFWHKERINLQKESFIKQQQSQNRFYEEIKNYNKKRQSLHINIDIEYRTLLSLPLEDKLDESQIKEAFKKVAKNTHPDVGGSHEEFIKVTIARDELLANII